MVSLTYYTLPDVPRTDAGQRHVRSYSRIEDLWNSRLDGLIVTGAEPRTANLMDEPYWASLIRVAEWADNNTYSTVWSCLAAHAAVLHMDGIGRRMLAEKRLGVFNCLGFADHALISDLPVRFRMPHSRWNDLPEAALRESGYHVLSRSEAGIDLFVKRRKSLFVFFQGHPEYETETLLFEYRRDVKRFLHRESDTYPVMPSGYFNDVAIGLLAAFRERALLDRCDELISAFPTALVAETLRNTWAFDATLAYRNWLSSVAEAKAVDRVLAPVGARWGD